MINNQNILAVRLLTLNIVTQEKLGNKLWPEQQIHFIVFFCTNIVFNAICRLRFFMNAMIHQTLIYKGKATIFCAI